MAGQLPTLPTYSIDLVPVVILEILKTFETPGNLWNLLNFRLISSSWNRTIQSAIQNKSTCVLTNRNINRFVDFLAPSTSVKPEESNIKSIILNLEADYDNVLETFVQLPKKFLVNLWVLEITFTVDRTPTFPRFLDFLFQLGELDLLKEFSLKLDCLEALEHPHGFSAKWFSPVRPTLFRKPVNIQVLPVVPGIVPLSSGSGIPDFSNLTKLTAPLHVSVHLLKCCSSSVLKHLTLIAYFISVEADFWKEFKNTILLNGHAATLTEFFIVNKLHSKTWICFGESWLENIWECNFTLRKLGLGLQYGYRKVDLVKLLVQQASTLEYLSIPRLHLYPSDPHYIWEDELQGHTLILENNIHFPRLQELHYDWFHPESGRMFPHFPSLKTLGLNIQTEFPVLPVRNFLEHCVSENIRNLIIKDMDKDLPVFQMFPRIERLTVSENLRDVLSIDDIFIYGTNLKALSIKFDLSEYGLQWEGWDGGEFTQLRQWMIECRSSPDYAVIAECFIVGFSPNDCKKYQAGIWPCNARTEFQQQNRRHSLRDLQHLEFLSLEGSFTELTVWAGIKELKQLTEVHLKSHYLMHPLTLIELEDYLPLLKYWSYTKLAKETKEVYRYFRYLPNSYASDQVQFWKFMDDNVCKTDKRIIKITEFAALDLNYTSLHTTPPDEYSFNVPYNFDANEDILEPLSENEDDPVEFIDSE